MAAIASKNLSVLQSRYRPFGVQQNACGRAANYWQIDQAIFLGLTPPALPPAPSTHGLTYGSGFTGR